MILQATTEKELLAIIANIQKTLREYQNANKALIKKMDAMQGTTNTIVKETIVKEIEKPIITIQFEM